MRSFKNEIQKNKNIVLEHILYLPYEILDNFEYLKDKGYNSEVFFNEFTIIMKKSICLWEYRCDKNYFKDATR